MPLQVDATVLYGLGKWHDHVGDAETRVDTPYNTYLHPGLPPGPIANPGLAAMKACLNPQKTDYLFYFTDRKGDMHYSSDSNDILRQQAQFGLP
jgi:UPF0755 protein